MLLEELNNFMRRRASRPSEEEKTIINTQINVVNTGVNPRLRMKTCEEKDVPELSFRCLTRTCDLIPCLFFPSPVPSSHPYNRRTQDVRR